MPEFDRISNRDDDAAVRDALSISLTMAGLKVEVYHSGKAFLDDYTEDRPGCLLINLIQSEMDGLTVQQELIRRNFQIPIIFMIGIGMMPGLFVGYAVWNFLLTGETFSEARCCLKVSAKQ